MQKVILKILEWIGMVIAFPIALFWNGYGMAFLIGVIWIMVADTEDMNMGEIVGRCGAIVLLIKLIQFIIKKVRNER